MASAHASVYQVFISEVEARRFAETGFVESPIRKFRPMLQENKDKSPARKGTPAPVCLQMYSTYYVTNVQYILYYIVLIK